MRYKLLVLMALWVADAQAQSVEAEWRVINTVSVTVVPAYQGQPNPFPMVEEVKESVAAIEEPMSEEAQHRAGVIARARELLGSNKVFKPDTSNISFKAYLKTANGEKVLYESEWIGIGSAISAPVKGAQQAYDTIQEVEAIDPQMGKTLRDELQARLSSSDKVSMKIVRIDPTEVTLKGAGESIKIAIRHAGL